MESISGNLHVMATLRERYQINKNLQRALKSPVSERIVREQPFAHVFNDSSNPCNQLLPQFRHGFTKLMQVIDTPVCWLRVATNLSASIDNRLQWNAKTRQSELREDPWFSITPRKTNCERVRKISEALLDRVHPSKPSCCMDSRKPA